MEPLVNSQNTPEGVNTDNTNNGAPEGQPEEKNIFKVDHQGKDFEYDISTDEGRKKVENLVRQGLSNSDQAESRKALQEKAKYADTWENLLQQSKAGNKEAQDKLVEFFTEYGLNSLFNANEDSIEMDETTQKIQSLENEIKGLKGELKNRDDKATVENWNSELTSMQNDKDNFPYFSRKDVIDHAEKLGTTNFKAAYRDLYYDKIIADRVATKEKELEALHNKRRNSFSEQGDSQLPPPTKIKAKNIKEAVTLGAQELESRGLSFFKD